MIINYDKKDTMKRRQSKQRERILELLKATKTHPTADWIYSQLKSDSPKLSQGTVYRNLGILLEQGRIRKIRYGSTFDRFEANLEQHVHLICEKCQSIIDIDSEVCDILVRKAEDIVDFSITGHQVEFYGLCGNCKKAS